MLKKVLLAVAVLLGVLAGVIASRPDAFTVQRSLTVDAPASVVFAFVSDLHAFDRWSPYAQRDPNMKKTFAGPQSGVGQSYAWEGNNDVGAGKMTIADIKPNEDVGITLDFERPMKSTSRVDFVLAADGAGTRVTWHMAGHNSFAGKAFGLVMDMDKLVGADFEKGLATLKTLAEAQAKAAAPAPSAPLAK